MKKLRIYFAVMSFLIGVFATNLQSNPLPSCNDEWCHYTSPNIIYHDFEWSDWRSSFDKKDNDWMAVNCPNWPDTNDPVFRALPYLIMRHEYERDIDEAWKGKNPNATVITYDGKQEKLREEEYLTEQRKKFGKNIPFCLTEKAQSRIEQERKETEKYLQHAQDVPMVRDRIVLLAKIEEANAKTAKEQGLENLYKKPQAWGVDKATLDTWWAETHPNGKPLDKQAIKQRYKDYFTKQEWKRANSNTPEPSIEEMEKQNDEHQRRVIEDYYNKVKNWWVANYPNWPQPNANNFPSVASDSYRNYRDDVDLLWFKHEHPEEADVTELIGFPDNAFSAPFEEREQYYLNKQKEIYGKNIPYCLTKEERQRLYEHRKYLEESLRKAATSPNESPYENVFESQEDIETQLQRVISAEKANLQIATELGLNSFIKNEAQHKERRTPRNYLLFTGFVALGIVVGAIIILLKRKKNLPK